jgi:hypothetical protein
MGQRRAPADIAPAMWKGYRPTEFPSVLRPLSYEEIQMNSQYNEDACLSVRPNLSPQPNDEFREQSSASDVRLLQVLEGSWDSGIADDRVAVRVSALCHMGVVTQGYASVLINIAIRYRRRTSFRLSQLFLKGGNSVIRRTQNWKDSIILK